MDLATWLQFPAHKSTTDGQGGVGQLGSSRGGGDQRVGSTGSPGAESAQRLSLEAEGLGVGAGVSKLKTLEAESSVRASPVWLLD